ncbi:MAG: cell wall hydrolase [Lachnospiraceae bacterium]
MLTIQNLLKKVYCGIKNISKKCYRNCAVIVSGFIIVAVISMNAQGFEALGRSKAVQAEGNVPKKSEEDNPKETEEITGVFAGSNFTSICKQALETEQSKLKQQNKIMKQQKEMLKVCSNIEPIPVEIPKEPLNPYGTIAVSKEDYETLCRIVQAEAGGEDLNGKILVAEVVLNRVLAKEFQDNVYDVVFEKSGGSAQFSPTTDGRFFTVQVTNETVEAVEQALNGEDISQGALFFSARSKANANDMAWFDRNLKWLFQYGEHEFYTLP